MSSEIRTKGVILRSSALGENSKAAVCFTENLGKISVALNGVKKINGKLQAVGQLFAFSELRLIKCRGSMYTLVGANVIDSFFGITQDYDSYNAACSITAKIIPVLQEELEDPQAFELYVHALNALDKQIKKPDFIETVFFIKFIDVLGWSPDIEELENNGFKNATLKAVEYILECDINKVFFFTVSDDVLLELKTIGRNMFEKFLR